MIYYGSKLKLSKFFIPILTENRRPEQFYVEPFCGGCNLIDKIGGNRIASDNNQYLIALLTAVRDGWIPSKLTKEEWNEIKNNKDNYDPKLVGLAGFCCSYKSRFFEGFAHHVSRDYQQEAINNLLKQANLLKGIEFRCSDYRKLDIPERAIVYCDPPYRGRKKYQGRSFDHSEFWAWCEEKGSQGYELFVSEYEDPPNRSNWKLVHQQEMKNSLSHQRRESQINTEKLFKFIGS